MTHRGTNPLGVRQYLTVCIVLAAGSCWLELQSVSCLHFKKGEKKISEVTKVVSFLGHELLVCLAGEHGKKATRWVTKSLWSCFKSCWSSLKCGIWGLSQNNDIPGILNRTWLWFRVTGDPPYKPTVEEIFAEGGEEGHLQWCPGDLWWWVNGCLFQLVLC